MVQYFVCYCVDVFWQCVVVVVQLGVCVGVVVQCDGGVRIVVLGDLVFEFGVVVVCIVGSQYQLGQVFFQCWCYVYLEYGFVGVYYVGGCQQSVWCGMSLCMMVGLVVCEFEDGQF